MSDRTVGTQPAGPVTVLHGHTGRTLARPGVTHREG